MLVSTGFLIFALYLAFSKYGDIKLGNPDDEVEHGTLSWLAMLFAAGIGTGLVFHGAFEPLYHMQNPPPGSLEAGATAADSARNAMAFTYLHWGFHPWGIYAICAITVAYFTFCRGKPMLASVPLMAIWGDGKRGFLYKTVDMIAVLAVVFGVAGSLAIGTQQMSSGLAQYGFNPTGKETYLIVLIAMGICYTISAISGLGRGIKILSDINILLCVLIMLFILFAGPTLFILETFVTSLGEYLSRFTKLSFDLRHFAHNNDWTEAWTITYLLWWIAWAPFVGIFIARISRGRTIRQFILGVLIVPSIFSFLWFSTLGGVGIFEDLYNSGEFGLLATTNKQGLMFILLEQFPWVAVSTVALILLIFIFLVTSADSGTYVLGMFTSDGSYSPPKFQRLFWGLMLSVVAAITLIGDRGLDFIKTVAVIGAIPYMGIMILQCWGLMKALKTHPVERREKLK